jgi:hypothetical protein
MADLYRSPLVIFNISLMFLSVVNIVINAQHMLDHRPWMTVVRFYKTSQVNIEKLPQYREKFECGIVEHRGLNTIITIISVTTILNASRQKHRI